MERSPGTESLTPSNEVRRLATLSDGTIRLDDLPDDLRGKGAIRVTGGGAGPPLREGEGLEDAERRLARELIQGVLEREGWNVSKAARTLRVGRAVLAARMAELGLRPPGGVEGGDAGGIPECGGSAGGG